MKTCAKCLTQADVNFIKLHSYKAHWEEFEGGWVRHEKTDEYWCHTHRAIGFRQVWESKRAKIHEKGWLKAVEALKDLVIHRFGNSSTQAVNAEAITRAYREKTAGNVVACP